MRPRRWQPTRLHRPRDSPGKNTGVGCHVLLQCMKGKREREVAQSCPTLGDPMDCSPPGSSVHGIFQSRVLKWAAIAFSDTVLYIRLLLSSPVTSTTECCFHFVSASSFFLELFLHSSPVSYWAPTNLGKSSFNVISFAFLYCSWGSQAKNTKYSKYTKYSWLHASIRGS